MVSTARPKRERKRVKHYEKKQEVHCRRPSNADRKSSAWRINGRFFCCLVNGHQNQGGTFWQECILQIIEMSLAQPRTLCMLNVDNFLLDSCEKTTEL